eukprot:s2873_g6.t1
MVQIQALERPLELWIGTAHFSPGVAVAVYEEEVHNHFAGLPRNAHRVVFQGDVNTAFGWTVSDRGGVSEVAKEGKGGILHKVLVERGLRMLSPNQSQMDVPTSRPRQEGRDGQCIDIMAVSCLRTRFWHIHVDSHLHIGTDHELCEGCLVLDAKRARDRHQTEPRVWCGGIQAVTAMDQSIIEGLARGCTKPAPGRGYRDPQQVRQAFRDAKRAGTAAAWKAALKMRKEARRGFGAFTMEELKDGVAHLKRGKAVGSDLTSAELIFGLMEVQGGPGHLLEWYNRILATGLIPACWNEPILVMLPKVKAPRAAKDLRPIAVGSAVCKLFSRLLLNRSIALLSPQSHAQCAGPGRQTSDFLYTIIRLFELSREWGNPLIIFKLDLEKAFDSLDRRVLLQKLEAKIGPSILQAPWGNSRVPMTRGIKQGAVESPVFFAYVAELALLDTIGQNEWRNMPRLFPDLPPEEMMYMDDGVLWNGCVGVVQTRAQQLSDEFLKYGLKMNPLKCQLYASPSVEGEHAIHLNGTKIQAKASLEVMGLHLRVGMSTYELISPASTRARAKFWELRHIFRAKGNMKERARVMERVIGGTALWFICSVPPDKASMTALNSTQLQLMVWLLRCTGSSTFCWSRKMEHDLAAKVVELCGAQGSQGHGQGRRVAMETKWKTRELGFGRWMYHGHQGAN